MLNNMHFVFFFFFKQKTAYEMRISDWSSDVCSSDLSDGQSDSAGERCRKPRPGGRHCRSRPKRRDESEARCVGGPGNANRQRPTAVVGQARRAQAGVGLGARTHPRSAHSEHGRESCRERGGPYETKTVDHAELKKNKQTQE